MRARGDQRRRSLASETSSRRFRLALPVVTFCGVTVSCQNNIDFGNLPGKPVCSVQDCGGNATTISGAVMIPALKSASNDAANAWLRAGHSLGRGRLPERRMSGRRHDSSEQRQQLLERKRHDQFVRLAEGERGCVPGEDRSDGLHVVLVPPRHVAGKSLTQGRRRSVLAERAR